MSFIVKGLDIPNKGETLKIEILPDGSILKNVHGNTWIFLKEEQSKAVQLSIHGTGNKSVLYFDDFINEDMKGE